MADLNRCTPTGAETECCFSRTLWCLVLILFNLVLYWHVLSHCSMCVTLTQNEKPNQSKPKEGSASFPLTAAPLERIVPWFFFHVSALNIFAPTTT